MLQGVLPPEELAGLIASTHRPNFALEMLSTIIDASTTVEVDLKQKTFRSSSTT